MTGPHHLFEVYGIEIERMVVDAQTLAVKPVVDSILADFAQAAVGVEDVEDGAIAWSNELVAHVVEAKNNGPVAALEGVAAAFAASTKKMLDVAKRHGARFMPTGMHPWMDPMREAVL
ncbi:MAG TPA: glutamate-cysteine ligase family protein, partial [Planctomycetota bacterium]|nr:glutamate-cysteine ligase family protein [Planctomycetota bacterium]